MSKRIRELLESADPARGVHVDQGDVEALLDRAGNDVTSLTSAEPPRRRASRLVPVGAFAVVVVAATTIVAVQTFSGPTGTAEPNLVPGSIAGSASCLTPVVDQLQSTSYDGGSGRYEYLRMTQSSGRSVQMTGGTTGMAVALHSQETARWLADDGSGRIRVVREAPEYPDEASRDFFAQRPQMLPTAGTETKELRPGELPLPTLPAADPVAMDRALYQPRENGPSQALVGVADLNRQRVLDLEHRAAVLRFLASTEGVTCRGEQTDPEGRTGIAVSADRGRGPQPSPGDQGREYLLFDARTGELLASSGNATTAGNVVWSTVYIERAYTDRLG
ncbi:CU044_5270 family protein [Polymorphospora sp. NPDC051019]|uniref:CU044_5270 family protein n=1 Tax=Polymorphospora sp. NPDC051019 TaxID=3155725 RepID=UPI0034134D4A